MDQLYPPPPKKLTYYINKTAVLLNTMTVLYNDDLNISDLFHRNSCLFSTLICRPYLEVTTPCAP
jgi:hypothetical protein